jgi:hypothetical protein
MAGGRLSTGVIGVGRRFVMSTVIDIRRTVKDAALAALARKPGRPGRQRDWQLEAARAEITQLTEAVKAQVIELAIVRGNPVGPERAGTGAGPRRGQGAGPGRRSTMRSPPGSPTPGRARCGGSATRGVHRWRARCREPGTLVDRAPGGHPMHALLPEEIAAILDVAERWGTGNRALQTG